VRLPLGTQLLVLGLVPLCLGCGRQAPPAGAGMPAPRELAAGEREALQKQIADRFAQAVEPGAQYRAAGSFRFVNTQRFLYLDRTDLGSLGLEMPQYGVPAAPLAPRDLEQNALLPRIEAAFIRTRLEADGRDFETFNDEFAGAAQPGLVTADFDPRRAGVQVARTAVYRRRTPDGIPVFGSELMIGLLADNTIGRFRLHWPKLDSALFNEARRLQETVRASSWSQPAPMREPGVTILDTTAGVAHSGFADPVFRASAVVRVTYRKTSPDRQYPTSSTGYKYFDASGGEVQFSAFPATAGTPADRKPAR
jgi:hypothetical protein